jgi:hypothetical protein
VNIKLKELKINFGNINRCREITRSSHKTITAEHGSTILSSIRQPFLHDSVKEKPS